MVHTRHEASPHAAIGAILTVDSQFSGKRKYGCAHCHTFSQTMPKSQETKQVEFCKDALERERWKQQTQQPLSSKEYRKRTRQNLRQQRQAEIDDINMSKQGRDFLTFMIDVLEGRVAATANARAGVVRSARVIIVGSSSNDAPLPTAKKSSWHLQRCHFCGNNADGQVEEEIQLVMPLQELLQNFDTLPPSVRNRITSESNIAIQEGWWQWSPPTDHPDTPPEIPARAPSVSLPAEIHTGASTPSPPSQDGSSLETNSFPSTPSHKFIADTVEATPTMPSRASTDSDSGKKPPATGSDDGDKKPAAKTSNEGNVTTEDDADESGGKQSAKGSDNTAKKDSDNESMEDLDAADASEDAEEHDA